MALVVAFFVWAAFATVEEVAVASGEVVPRGKVKVIQHLEGGIVDGIFVAEGDTVRAGDVLVRLDLATAGVNRNELLARLDREEMKRVATAGRGGGDAARPDLYAGGTLESPPGHGRGGAEDLRGEAAGACLQLGGAARTTPSARTRGAGTGGEEAIDDRQPRPCPRAADSSPKRSWPRG